ncbi:hypothetical protein [Streptomyces sp. TLI_171]|uniref:hypothetical protein n=1 Tax=Streptomyces sp. TLI_171 TaxID=1938859 RepID=UPI00117D24D9|nr:hypothetical protein [Streptomyces sp. TLI_171]
MTRAASSRAAASRAAWSGARNRPGAAQLCAGTLIAAGSAVALLAVSGELGVWRIAVLVAFAVALGLLSTVLLTSVAARRRPSPAVPEPTAPGAPAPAPPVPASAAQPVYAHQAR